LTLDFLEFEFLPDLLLKLASTLIGYLSCILLGSLAGCPSYPSLVFPLRLSLVTGRAMPVDDIARGGVPGGGPWQPSANASCLNLLPMWNNENGDIFVGTLIGIFTFSGGI